MARRLGLACLVALVTVTATMALDLAAVETDEEGVQELREAVSLGWVPSSKKIAKAHLTHAMERGWWNLAHELIEHSRSNKVDLTASVYQNAASIRKRLKSLETALRGKKKAASGIAPAFQWAQNPEFIFLNVKFAHKWDTPATLGCEADNITYADKKVSFVSNCETHNKKFALQFQPLRELDMENSTWTMSSVGRAVLTLRKAYNSTWSRLLKGHKKPGNMHVWWSMKEKYEKANEEFDKAERRRLANANSTVAEDNKAKKEAAKAEAASKEAEKKAKAEAPKDTPEDEKPLSEFDVQVGELQKKYRKLKRAVDEELKTKIAAVDKDARQKKVVVMEEAKAKKQEIATAAATSRAAATDEAIAQKKTLDEQLAGEIEALGQRLGTGAATTKDEL